MVKSAYIHIPFCKKKCNYCTFVSYENLIYKKEYIDALEEEIKFFYKDDKLDTLYFGGGTPSLLDIEDIKKILDIFNFDEDPEITIEINPETVDKNYLLELYNSGINRLSFGVQDFNDKILKNIGRIHTSKKAEEVIIIAQDIGFKNINLDLIYGLPQQTKQMFLYSLQKAFDLEVQHISFYGLKIDEGCYFYSHPPKNLPSEDMQADYYISAINQCRENGFEHYEISNFSKKGFNSRHNLNYWNNNYYYGFGVAASGYEDNIRYYNESSLKNYIINPCKRAGFDILSKDNQLEEEIFLGFRKMEGIDVEKINQKYGIDFELKYKEIIKKYINSHILKTLKGYKFSLKGALVSNVILADFLC